MATCPACGIKSRDDNEAITVKEVLTAEPLGTHSLSGSQLKTVAVTRLQLVCRCGWSILGWIEGVGVNKHFLGDPKTQVWPAKSRTPTPEE